MVAFESYDWSNAMEIFYRLNPDYVIINASLIAEDGIHVLEGFVQLCQESHVPVLIYLDTDDCRLHLQCIALADDVIAAKAEPAELIARVIRNLKKRNRILDQILIDPMTGIYNQWADWDMPQYHERLKKSYYIMKDLYDKISINDSNRK